MLECIHVDRNNEKVFNITKTNFIESEIFWHYYVHPNDHYYSQSVGPISPKLIHRFNNFHTKRGSRRKFYRREIKEKKKKINK